MDNATFGDNYELLFYSNISCTINITSIIWRTKLWMKDFVKNNVDILFSNEGEIKSLYEIDILEDAYKLLKEDVAIGVVTQGDKGAAIIEQKAIHKIEAFSTKVIDTTGAGDFFAAGLISCNYLRFEL